MFKGTVWPNKYVIESVEPFVCWIFCEVNQWIQKYTYKSKLEDKIELGLFSHSTGG